MVMVFGEITTKAKVDYEKVVRETLAQIGKAYHSISSAFLFFCFVQSIITIACLALIHIRECVPT